MVNKISTDLIRGHTDTIILNVLRHDDSYGYQIYKTIIEMSESQYETQGGRRKYYRITEEGIERYEQYKKEWNFAKGVLNKLIEGGVTTDEKQK